MQNLNNIGNKYDITVYEWYEKIAKAEKKLAESKECFKLFGDCQNWVTEDTHKLLALVVALDEVKRRLKVKGIKVDYKRLEALAKNAVNVEQPHTKTERN